MKAVTRTAVALGAILAVCCAWDQPAANPWRFSASMAYYDVPHADDFWNPILTADSGRLHLEARHNYVAIGTTSVWAGVNFAAGTHWTFNGTLLFGIVGGSVQGVGAGYELTLNREWFQLSGQGEYIYDPRDEQDNSLYSWTEITGSPVGWCRLGVVGQRTKNYGMHPDIQRGLVAAFTRKKLEFELDVLDPDRADTTYILTLTFSF